jgi:ribosomal-protein-alanine N-acetyltransferase
MDCPRIETARLVLRAITPDDRAAVFENYSDPDVARWFFDQPYTRIEQADQIIRRFIERTTEGAGLAWAIVLVGGGDLIGTCSYEHFDGDLTGEIGFDLGKKHWGHGYMTEALGSIVDHGFSVLGLVKIRADTYSDNLRARRVLEKLGFSVDSIGEDSHCYTLKREGWARERT